MTIQQLIQITQNRISHLETVKAEAFRIGDAEAVERYQAEIDTSVETLAALRTLA